MTEIDPLHFEKYVIYSCNYNSIVLSSKTSKTCIFSVIAYYASVFWNKVQATSYWKQLNSTYAPIQ